MGFTKPSTAVSVVFTLLLIAALVSPVAAFGAGDIPETSGLEDYNWKHGDIANVLLKLPVSFITKHAFTELEKRTVYFGNWLRDYSQVIDSALLKKTNASVLLAIVSILGFMEHGFATDEFDVTPKRLGVYRHEHHIDNPRGYDGKEAQSLDSRLRGPVDPKEYDVDLKTGMKNYIANNGQGWKTAADYISEELRLSIQCGREGATNDTQRKEAFIHLGAALHTLEDFAAHSNFTELCLIRMGEQGVFPYVGDQYRIEGPQGQKVPPLVTGTFGPLDVLQSILGEFDDKAAMQNRGELTNVESSMEIEDGSFPILIDAIRTACKQLQVVPGAGDAMGTAVDKLDAMNQNAKPFDLQNSPPPSSSDEKSAIWAILEPAFTVHDIVAKFVLENEDILKPLSTIQKAISEAVNNAVYSFISIVFEPTIRMVRNEMLEGKNVIQEEDASGQSSVDIFGENSKESDPSHSLIAKDHFSNILNRPSGLVATATTNWTTQQVVRCWDDGAINVDDQIKEILKILHHPMFADGNSFIQNVMYQVVKEWWTSNNSSEQDDVRSQLSKAGVKANKNNSIKDASQFAGKPSGPARFTGSEPVLRQKEKTVVQQLVEALTNAAQTLEDALESIDKGVGEIGDAVDEFTDDAAQALDDGVTTVWTGAENAAGGITSALNDAGNAIVEVVDDAGNAISDAANDAANTVSTAVDDAGNAIAGAANDAGNFISNTANDVGNAVEDAASNTWSAVTGFFDL